VQKDQIQTSDYPPQGTWDKEDARFQRMETPCQSIKASFKASLKILKIFVMMFF